MISDAIKLALIKAAPTLSHIELIELVEHECELLQPTQKAWVALSADDIKGITLASAGNIFSAIMFTHDKLKDKNYD